MNKIILTLLTIVFLTSCSSITSIESPKGDDINGLSYYMPKKDFLVTVSVKDGNATKVTLGTTHAYPDLSKQYSLQHGSNFLGKNTLSVVISEKGLLTSSKSTTVSNVTDAFKNLATTYGQLRTFDIASSSPAADCTTDSDHIFTYSNVGTYTSCGINVTIAESNTVNATEGHSNNPSEAHSGIFYRQNQPFTISAVGQGLNVSSIVFSPSHSKTLFLPVSKTFFANNSADFGFVDGVPTKYIQDTDSEAIALLKLPADILGAYFSAVGSVFDSFKTNNTKESAALSSSLTLELAKNKYAACLDAIEAEDTDLVDELECK